MDKIYLKKLKDANFPPCDVIALGLKFDIEGDPDPGERVALENYRNEIIKYVNEYLKVFLAPIEKLDEKGQLLHIECVNCGEALGGLFGTFTWGLAHGEGYCSNCGYPARAKHFLEHEGWKFTMNRILQYHPSVLKRKVKK